MSNVLAVTVGGVHKTGKKAFLTVDAVHRQVKKAWRTTNGVYRLCYKSGPSKTSLSHHGTVTSLSNAVWCLMGGEIKGAYAVLYGGWLSSGYTDVANAYNANLTRATVSTSVQKGNGGRASTDQKCIFAGGANSSGLVYQSVVLDENLTVSKISHSSDTHLLSGTMIGGTTLNGRAFFAGGMAGSMKATAGVVDDDLTVTMFDNLSVARYEGACANINQKYALHAGGYGSSPSAVVDCYDESGTHIVLTNLSAARNRLSAANQEERAMFAGGYGSSFVSAVEIYDENLTMSLGTALSQARNKMASGSFDDGCVFAGGFYSTASGGVSTACDFYDVDCVRANVSGLTAIHGDGAGATVSNRFIVAGGANKYSSGTRTNVARAFTYKEDE